MAEEEKLNEANQEPILTTQSVDLTKIFGFDGKVSAVEKLLLGEESKGKFKALGLVGMKGIGKTTLCQVLFNQQEVRNYFLPRIWVCLSTAPGQDQERAKIEIATRMLKSLGANKAILESPSHKDDLKKLVYALNMMLRGKRYLIVFDGAVDDHDWFEDLHSDPPRDKNWSERLAYGLPKGHGGAVIVTSRSKKVAEKMVGKENKENLYSMLPLPDTKSCWSIFKKSVREAWAKDKEINEEEVNVKLKEPIVNKEELKKDIKQECAGVPIMAKLLGEVFYQHNKDRLTKKPDPIQTETCKEEKDSSTQKSPN